ncbi:MAG: hypothetical protein P1V20_19510 [Verrucomicrobiales bacterium]|nr:hypothetical protein [Verrucomicrobiales bacterium]
MIHLLLWMGWLLLAYFVVASFFMLRSETEALPSKTGLRIALIAISILGFALGWAAAYLKKQLFWVRRKVTLEDSGGRAIFLAFSMAALTGGGLSALALFAPRIIWGEQIMPIAGIGIGLVFLVLLFPRIPGKISGTSGNQG